jgi:hypothetical protein
MENPVIVLGIGIAVLVLIGFVFYLAATDTLE